MTCTDCTDCTESTDSTDCTDCQVSESVQSGDGRESAPTRCTDWKSPHRQVGHAAAVGVADVSHSLGGVAIEETKT